MTLFTSNCILSSRDAYIELYPTMRTELGIHLRKNMVCYRTIVFLTNTWESSGEPFLSSFYILWGMCRKILKQPFHYNPQYRMYSPTIPEDHTHVFPLSAAYSRTYREEF